MSVHQHWDPLEACLVGKSYPPEFYEYIKNPKVRNVFERIAIETEEDYQKLISKLEEFNVEVVRMHIGDIDEYVSENQNDLCRVGPPMQPRDFTAMVGDRLYMPGDDYCKLDSLESLYYGMFGDWTLDNNEKYDQKVIAKYIMDIMEPGRPHSKAGAYAQIREKYSDTLGNLGNAFMSMIDTKELKEIVQASVMSTIGKNHNRQFNRPEYPDVWQDLREWANRNKVECVYDTYVNTASMWRIGKNLRFNLINLVSYVNHDHFRKKWEGLFPDYNVDILPIPGHCDGGCHPIVPGLIAGAGSPESYAKYWPGWEFVDVGGTGWDQVKPFLKLKEQNRGRWWIPGEENNQDLIDFVSTWMDDWVTYVEETVFDVNMLVIDEKNIICNNYNKNLFDALDRWGITAHLVNFRHRYFWDGGLHCITSDLKRRGEQHDYSDTLAT